MRKKLRSIPGTHIISATVRTILHITFFLIFNIFSKIENKKIVFESFNGKEYSCNPRAISEELNKKDPNFKIIWLFLEPYEKINNVPNYVIKVKKKSLRALYERYTAQIWVSNCQLPKYILKRKKQLYLQTWHGDRAFKKILYDYGKGKNIIENKICNVMTTGSKFGEKLLKSAFSYNGDLLRYGSPRNDILINGDNREKDIIKEKLGIDKNTNIILFAPTFRKDNKRKQDIKEINLSEVINKLKVKYNCNWICLIRSHSNVRELIFNKGTTNDVIDVSTYEDMADILLISDLLITDYSSSAGDFVLKDKPVILFQPDRESYLKNDRELYIPIEETPFFVVNSQEELLEFIDEIKDNVVINNCKEIMDFYGFYETGKASEKVVDYILKNP